MESPLNIAVCEDSQEDAEKLLGILGQCAVPNTVTLFPSGEKLLRQYRPMDYDLILTDIYMTGLTGIETVTRIRRMDPEIPVAFITTSADFALESYRLAALKYIEKPYREKDILDILTLAKLKRDSGPALAIRKNGKDEFLPFRQILYAEQQTHHLSFFLRNGESVTVCEKLSAFMDTLGDHDFFSPHKSYAVNMNFVRSLDTDLRCFVLGDGKNIPIRRESLGKAKKALQDHLFCRARGE